MLLKLQTIHMPQHQTPNGAAKLTGFSMIMAISTREIRDQRIKNQEPRRRVHGSRVFIRRKTRLSPSAATSARMFPGRLCLQSMKMSQNTLFECCQQARSVWNNVGVSTRKFEVKQDNDLGDRWIIEKKKKRPPNLPGRLRYRRSAVDLWFASLCFEFHLPRMEEQFSRSWSRSWFKCVRIEWCDNFARASLKNREQHWWSKYAFFFSRVDSCHCSHNSTQRPNSQTSSQSTPASNPEFVRLLNPLIQLT